MALGARRFISVKTPLPTAYYARRHTTGQYHRGVECLFKYATDLRFSSFSSTIDIIVVYLLPSTGCIGRALSRRSMSLSDAGAMYRVDDRDKDYRVTADLLS